MKKAQTEATENLRRKKGASHWEFSQSSKEGTYGTVP